MTKDTLILAHYYCIPEVQQMADYVGDSLDLALTALQEKPKRIVFAGVRFMAETCKIILPDCEVILPDYNSTCSLVEMTDLRALKLWRMSHHNYVHVAYINSSAEHKAISDWIVTSRNVADIIQHIYDQGKKVIFSPDRNMGAYLNYQFQFNMPLWHAVCEVHDRFKETELDVMFRRWTDYPKYLIAHPEAPLPVLKRADFVGSTHGMLNWIKEFPHEHGTIYVATEEGILYNMKLARPSLDIQQAPLYTGCQCNQCPYMKKNTVDNVKEAIEHGTGYKIDYLSHNIMERAYRPIKRMMDFETKQLELI